MDQKQCKHNTLLNFQGDFICHCSVHPSIKWLFTWYLPFINNYPLSKPILRSRDLCESYIYRIFCGKMLSTHILLEALKSSERMWFLFFLIPSFTVSSHEEYSTQQFVFPKLYSFWFNCYLMLFINACKA